MKNILLFIFLVPLLLQSQWTTSSGSNKFDGKYRSASVIGKGGKFPYIQPTLVLNKFDDNLPSLYLTNIGYTGCSDNKVYFSFNGSEEVFTTSDVNVNSNNDALFIDGFETLSELVFIELLRTRSKLYIRYKSSCGSKDFEFGLNGSSKAIDFATGHYYEELAIETERLINEKLANKIKLAELHKAIETSFNCANPLKIIYKFKSSTSFMKVKMLDGNSNKEIEVNKGDEISIYNRWKDQRILVSMDMEDTKNKIYYTHPMELWYLTEDEVIKWIVNNRKNLFIPCESIGDEEFKLLEAKGIN